jgi:hypothetical protein
MGESAPNRTVRPASVSPSDSRPSATVCEGDPEGTLLIMSGPDPVDEELTGVARDAETIIDVLRVFEADGYHSQFMAASPDDAPTDALECTACRATSHASDVGTRLLRRLEGASDPDDMLAIAALVCPHCGSRGTIVLNYGPLATPQDSAILRTLEQPAPPSSHLEA